MDGETFKRVESDLRKVATKYSGSAVGSESILGEHLNDAANLLRESLVRSSPATVREQLKRADTAWAIFKRMQGASVRRATGDGTFTPGDLLQTIKSQDKSTTMTGVTLPGSAPVTVLVRHLSSGVASFARGCPAERPIRALFGDAHGRSRH